jgi:hypothetical protein
MTIETYKLGLEDGFMTIGESIINGYDSSVMIQPKCTYFKGVPFIKTKTGYNFISEGDAIVTNSDERFTINEDKLLNLINKLKESINDKSN